MPDHLPLFEINLRQRRRTFRWYLCTSNGRLLMQGSETSRAAARYRANRALFLMFLASALCKRADILRVEAAQRPNKTVGQLMQANPSSEIRNHRCR